MLHKTLEVHEIMALRMTCIFNLDKQGLCWVNKPEMEEVKEARRAESLRTTRTHRSILQICEQTATTQSEKEKVRRARLYSPVPKGVILLFREEKKAGHPLQKPLSCNTPVPSRGAFYPPVLSRTQHRGCYERLPKLLPRPSFLSILMLLAQDAFHLRLLPGRLEH